MLETILIAAKSPPEVPDLSESFGNNFSVAIAICAAILFVSVWLMLRGRLLKPRTPKHILAIAPVKPSEAEEKATERVAKIYETVREITGQIDTKIRLLNVLIQDADRAATRLEAARRGEAPPIRVGRSAESSTDEIYLYSDYGLTASDIASRLEVSVESIERILGARELQG